jgi:hypothetical protein
LAEGTLISHGKSPRQSGQPTFIAGEESESKLEGSPRRSASTFDIGRIARAGRAARPSYSAHQGSKARDAEIIRQVFVKRRELTTLQIESNTGLFVFMAIIERNGLYSFTAYAVATAYLPSYPISKVKIRLFPLAEGAVRRDYLA